ncbi:universal stress protein [Baekduia sp. Peel2402]|uniref:universal stress protein n=1 Tax=Baekduia sp. Peel2402 TaxID=3458296 RepID=UPI00403EE575
MSAPILTQYDPDRPQLAPLRFAATVAAVMGAPLVIGAAYAGEDVVDPLADVQMGEGLPRNDPRPALEAVVRELGIDGEHVDTAALGATTAPRALHLAAVELGAGLLVVPPGTTAERLLDGAPCAVAVVPTETGGESQDDAEHGVTFVAIGVGLVETPEAEAAVRGAELLARRAGARLRVLCAVRPGNADLHRRVEEYAGAVLPAEPGVRIDIDVDDGDPRDLLVAASSEVDVLVCGSRCYGPHPATLRGGVTRHVTAEAAGPVIVMARRPDVRFEELLGD